MRRYATFFLIAVMSLGLAFLLATRARTPHDAPLADPEIVELGDAGDAGKGDAATLADAADAAKPVERPLRITTLGWELVAPGVALTAPDGGPIDQALELAPEATLEAVEARLARGGIDPVGADVAILPLPAFVLAYDRLRALDPRAFAVIGFSRGREEVHATTLLKPPPGGDEVKLVALGPATAGDVGLRTSGSESATMLGLFALDLLGVAPTRVRLVGTADAKGALFAAVVRGAADERKLAFSSADASRFVPIVAVAPKSQLDASEAKLRDFARAWLGGVERAGKDASSVARRLANKEALPLAAGVGGAPEAIVLLERLGQIAPATLAQQRGLLGPLAKGPATVELVAQRQWALARAAGLTTAAAPLLLPFDDRIVTAIAPAPAAVPPPAPDADAGAFPALPSGTTPLLVYRADVASDAAAVATQIGFLSGVFERSAFRVSAKGGEKAARAIAAAARERFDLPTTRLATVAGEPAGAFAIVEVLALP